jgi:hypothetical protein
MNRVPVPSAAPWWEIPGRLVAGEWLDGVFAWRVFAADYLARPEAWALRLEKAFEEAWSSG